MIELAAIDTALGLFKQMLSLKDGKRTNKQLLFEKTIEPLFTQLEPISNEYRQIIVDLLNALSDDNCNLYLMLKTLNARRDGIVMARNKITGFARGLNAVITDGPSEHRYYYLRNISDN